MIWAAKLRWASDLVCGAAPPRTRVLRQLSGGNHGSEDARHHDTTSVGDRFVAAVGMMTSSTPSGSSSWTSGSRTIEPPGTPSRWGPRRIPLGHRRGVTRLLRFVTGPS